MTNPVETFSTYVQTLPSATSVAGSDEIYLLQGGVSKSVSATNLAAFLPPGPSGPAGASGTGPININSLTNAPLVGDGLTSNATQLQSLASTLQSVGPEFPVAVTLSIASPAVVTWPQQHFLRPNQAFKFTISGGGNLPTGVTTTTTYYVTSANLTTNTFTFSTVNNYNNSQSEGIPVNTTGTQSGTVSVVLSGRSWLDIAIPPGSYTTAGTTVYMIPNGISRSRWHTYGAVFSQNEVVFSVGGDPLSDPKTWVAQTTFDYVNTTPNELGVPNLNGQITLQTIANTSRYFVGQWIVIFGYDLQNDRNVLNSGPPNNHFWEFKQIIAINSGTGVITVDGPLKWIYLSTFPNMFNVAGTGIGGGKALIAAMNPIWDTEIEVLGARFVQGGVEPFARRITFTDCVWQGDKSGDGFLAPNVSKEYIYRNCRFGPTIFAAMEPDKVMEYLEYDRCEMVQGNGMLFASSSVHHCLIRRCKLQDTGGTPRQIRIEDSEIDRVRVGVFTFGLTDSVQLFNNRISYFDKTIRTDDPINVTPSLDMTLVPNWSFSNGTFTRNLSGVAQAAYWQIPGAKIYFTDFANQFDNMGSPFAILNTTMDVSGNFSFETTLKAVPTRQTSHTATITIASPAVVTWTAHGLTANTPVCFTTTGVLPTGLSISTVYFVLATGLTANTFEVSTSVGGAAVNTSGTQSGVHTAFGNPLCFGPHPCPRLTASGNSGCMAILDHNGAVDEPIFSRVKRLLVGQHNTVSTSSQFPYPRIWGTLISMTANVIQAATAGSVTITCPGFTQPNLALSTFSQTINLTVAGKRIVTNTGSPTGTQAGDTLTTYADWIAGPLQFNWSGTPANTVNSALMIFEMYTDQGITRFGVMQGYPNAGNNEWTYIDSGILQQSGVP